MLECEAFFLIQSQKQPVKLEPVDLSLLSKIRQNWSGLEKMQLVFIGALDDADMIREVQVQLVNQEFVFSVGELLLRALIHSIHYRGELSVVLTGLGHPLPTLDIILHFIGQSGQAWMP